MNKFKENLKIFKNYSQELYNTLINEKDLFNTKIEKVKEQNNYIIEIDNIKCFVHSLYNIENEMDIMFKDIDNNAECLIIFGLGCGYALQYINKNFKFINKIIIIEPNLSLFKEYLKQVDIYKVVSKFKEISFIINKTKEESTLVLSEILTSDVYKQYSMIYNTSYRTIYNGYYEHINKNSIEIINNKLVNIVTNEMFKYIWPVNIIRNMKYSNQLVDDLFGKFGNIPAILVSAGPSLNKNIHLLKAVKNKAIIVAVGSSIKILNNAGINPHFNFAVDGGKSENLIFKSINSENTTLIYGDKLYYEILPRYKGKKLKMILNLDFLGKYIHDKSNIKYTQVKSGFSISNIALDVINLFGCRKVIFMGQDLCYSDKKEYADGSWKKEDLNFDKNDYIKKIDIYGNDVFTIVPYLGIKKIFENYIEKNNYINYINATEGGLGINGTTIKNFQDVLREDLIEEYPIDIIINQLTIIDNNKNSEKIINGSILIMKEEVLRLLTIIDKTIESTKEEDFNNSLNVIKDKYKVIENQLESISFYRDVVKNNLKTNFDVINMKFNSNVDKKILIKNVLNKLIETREFLHLIEALIKEYFGEIKLDIEFE